MLLLKIENGVPRKYTVKELTRDHPNVSFPKDLTPQSLEGFDVLFYTEVVPDHNPMTHTYRQGDFELTEDGWVLNYNIVQLDRDIAEENVRAERDKRLAETDYWMLMDHTPTALQMQYRRRLRDITTQFGYPYDVEWPVYNKEEPLDPVVHSA